MPPDAATVPAVAATVAPTTVAPPTPAPVKAVTVERKYVTQPKVTQSAVADHLNRQAAEVVADKAVVAPAVTPEAVGEKAAEPTKAEPAKVGEVTQEEEFKRRARILRQERALHTKRTEFNAERSQHTEALKRVELVNKIPEMAKTNVLGVLQGLGISTQSVLDAILGDTAKTPAQKQQERMGSVEERVAAYEKQLKEELGGLRREREAQQVDQHIRQNILPVLTPTSFPHLHHAAELMGQNLGDAIYKAQWEHFEKTRKATGQGVVLDPKVIAERAEKQYAEKAKILSGASAAPAQQAAKNGTTPPKASQGVQATQPQSIAQRRKPAPYKANVVGR